MSQIRSNSVHFLAGGIGGATGVFVACPLDVIKTRQQSSVFNTRPIQTVSSGSVRLIQLSGILTQPYSAIQNVETVVSKPGILQCFRLIIRNEGFRALYKGLTPALAGVVPYRAIYFATYAKSKKKIKKCGLLQRDSSLIPPIAGWIAGAAAVTVTCPIWVLKTRLQLDNRKGLVSMKECVQRLFQSEGIRGFYRGLVISYIGLGETMIQFYLYEVFKSAAKSRVLKDDEDLACYHCLPLYALAASASKIIACTTCYPHEVIRTRLRQPIVSGNKVYKSIGQTLWKVASEEGARGLYGGLGMQLLRMIPQTATMFVVYEAIVSLCNDST